MAWLHGCMLWVSCLDYLIRLCLCSSFWWHCRCCTFKSRRKAAKPFLTEVSVIVLKSDRCSSPQRTERWSYVQRDAGFLWSELRMSRRLCSAWTPQSARIAPQEDVRQMLLYPRTLLMYSATKLKIQHVQIWEIVAVATVKQLGRPLTNILVGKPSDGSADFEFWTDFFTGCNLHLVPFTLWAIEDSGGRFSIVVDRWYGRAA